MKRIIEKINEALNKIEGIGYIEIKYNGEEVGHFATKKYLEEEGIETENGMIFLKNNHIEDIKDLSEKIRMATKIKVFGDFYGDGFSDWLIEGINFCNE